MQTLRRILLPLPLLAVSAAAPGQPAGAEPDPLFQVEIIVFAYDAGNRAEEDFFHGRDNPRREPMPKRLRLPSLALASVPDRRAPAAGVSEPSGTAAEAADPPPDAAAEPDDRLSFIERGAGAAARDGAAAGATAAPGSGTDVAVPAGFRILPAEAYELTAAARGLGNDRRYTVLGHTGWIQAGVDRDRSVALDLSWLGITNPAGTIEVYLRRFLHVAVDLTWHEDDGTFWRPPPGPGLDTLDYAAGYRLVDERNAMRSGEPHYIDHPLFGVIVLINRAPEPESGADGATGNGGPAG